MGGVNTVYNNDNAGLSFSQPALLTGGQHGQFHVAFNNYLAGAKTYHTNAVYHHEKLKTTLQYGLVFLDYGQVTQTDAAGNISGEFKPTDWVIQASAGRTYLDKWHYGFTVKFISSAYGIYRSNGVAADAGVTYKDSVRNISIGVLAKNMGIQLKTYQGTDKEDLPFDLQVGISKKLKESPFAFSLNLHHLHQFDLLYNDTIFNRENGRAGYSDTRLFFEKLFSHIVLATHVDIGTYVTATIGYNHLRRKELNIGSQGNGFNAFSGGFTVKTKKLSFQYAHTRYQFNNGYHLFGLSLNLPEL